MKQTAVEFLWKWIMKNPFGSFEEGVKAYNEAIEMEKEQIMDAHIEGQRVFDDYPHTQWTNDVAEQYYNETFKKE